MSDSLLQDAQKGVQVSRLVVRQAAHGKSREQRLVFGRSVWPVRDYLRVIIVGG
jgi:hypothetical protein